MPFSLRELLSQPFGPFTETCLDIDFLKRRHLTLALSSVRMFLPGREGTGLNETEFVDGFIGNVQFVGRLVIEDLRWLSTPEYEQLERELRERDSETNNVQSGLTLEAIYGHRPGEGSRVTIWLLCNKNMTATFLTSNLHATSLLLKSTSEKSYKITSFDVHTYKRSHRYLERYRLLAMVDEFVKATETSIVDCTIDWLVECICQRHDVDSSERRILYDSEDSEIEIEIEWDDEGSRGKLRRPRHARHLSKAEARSVLAKDARWLLAEQLGRRADKRTLSVYALCRFCSEIARMKQWNGRRRPRVGEVSAMALQVFGVNINLNKYYRKGKTKAQWQEELKRASEPIPAVSEPEQTLPEILPVYHYDDDMSQASTSAASDAEDAWKSDLRHSIGRSIPPWLATPPTLPPPGTFTWNCNCGNHIDVLEWCKGSKARTHGTTLQDSDVLFRRLLRAISDHYEEHLEQIGILEKVSPLIALSIYGDVLFCTFSSRS
ncbi:hypothetical protein EDD18DRAFT_1122503 [Armillaria luteobubalina]|uniref:Uncharacterized protein n=1 Tax=Armillaria luteobubalina TaxID=153913 RepID=A0AA39QNH1_9AGAR|nr:hypothetical protein EDD18DRAFT_1122503 [Armillaria luteobubalina]